jgi:uncharacterized damage-inducible protein DinB
MRKTWPNIFREARFLSAVDFVQADRFRRKVAEEMAPIFSEVDLLLVPSLRDEMLTLTTFTGHPSLTLRAGFVNVSKARSDWVPDPNNPMPTFSAWFLKLCERVDFPDRKETFMKRAFYTFLLFVVAVAAVRVTAQVHPYRDGTPGVTGYRSEVMALVMIQGDEFTRLAEAIPAEKYSWRPAPGVRSVAEVLLHVSAANYNMYKSVGAKIPEGVDTRSMEQSTTDRVKVITTLKESYAHARKAIVDVPDADLEKTMDWSGGKITERGVLMFIVPHIAEHLGQLIAYARILGVVPPWTEDEQKRQAEKTESQKG